MQGINFIFLIAILILSVIAHEVSHGYIAYLLGDPTAKRAGRLSMNPLKHLDMTGSFIVPLMLILLKSSFVFGWAKPVPYNPYNLKNQKWGPGLVAISGPLSNFLIAGVFGLVALFLPIDNSAKTEIGMAAVNRRWRYSERATLRLFLLFFHGCLDKYFLGHFQSYPHSAFGRLQSPFSFLPYKWNNFEIFFGEIRFFHSFVFSFLFFFCSSARRFLFV